ncbi:MAG: hypothetical protein ACTIKR_08110 [Advenella sp.]|uniref:hypothetical protein n=1 Tax=Advenella sp. TaxID=1872388 RepID=UPI003F968713
MSFRLPRSALRLFNLLVVMALAAYPFLVYYGKERIGALWITAGLLLLWGVKSLLSRQRWQQIVVLALLVCVMLFQLADKSGFLYFYPVVINLVLLAVFAGSLFTSMSVVERIARSQEPDLPQSAIQYTRAVTKIWIVFFILNGSTIYLLWQAGYFHVWSLYTGFISYVLMGLLFAGEWIYRQHYKRKHAA